MSLRNVERMSLWLVRVILWPLVQLILAFGSAVAVTLQLTMLAGRMQAHVAICNDGPSPTGMQSGNMPQAKFTTHYNKVFIEHLTKTLITLRLCTMMTMPQKSGQMFRNFMQLPLSANTTQATEGTIGNPIQVSTNFEDIIMGQWVDYTNVSDKAFITSITDDMTELRKNLGYRLAFSMDDLTMIQFDSLITLDPKTKNQDSLTTPYPMTKAIIEQMPHSLEGQDVQPMEGGYFRGKIHPFLAADLVALDTSNNSIVDVWKHTTEGQMRLEGLDNYDAQSVKVLELFGARWMKSTNCTQTPNWQGGGTTAVSTYLAGKDAMIFVNLPRENGTSIADGNWRNMTLWAGEYSQGNSYDPARVIAAGTSYNLIGGWGAPPDPTSRARIARAVPQTT
jgi:hypothetical protein